MNAIQEEIDRFARSDFLYEGQVYQAYLEVALHTVDSTFGYFHLFDNKAEELQLTVWSSEVIRSCTTSHEGHYPVSKAGVWADCIRQRTTVIHNDYAALTGKKGLPEGHFRLDRHMSTPIIVNDEIVGVVGAGNRASPYGESDILNLEYVTRRCFPLVRRKVGAIVARRLQKDLQLKNGDAKELLVSMVSALTKATALRDEYTALHEENVSRLAVSIGEKMGLSEHELLGLRLGGLVHDIGKMAVPSEVLNKIGKILPAEIALIRIHPEMGAQIFEHLHTPWPIQEMIEQHHERMDGTGYPRGLRSEQIALEARIIAVADVYDSMSTDRPYRFAPGHRKARDEIMSGRGTRYDPYVVDAFMEYLRVTDAVVPKLREQAPALCNRSLPKQEDM